MILYRIEQIIRHHPYIIPIAIVLLLIVLTLCFWEKIVHVAKSGNCRDCPEGKDLCLVACERVSRRLDEIDRQIEARQPEAVHPAPHALKGAISPV
jgi:hypothetical protein